ncbi:MAG: DnaJ family molecular chaperone [Candidatus Devosia phytovorans]|uniref:DnaJ family molecular chaperone n=1 Tax=Candidatus Devosia phytovorans TaxID=3121372 RepID=A0AAJ6B156_9HYPH|nr:DnaJ family molecular chaperone [Devosia sp.]WEK05421.1 MAG: DnaJ family molecular chaperone [Devosia sp.]
MPDSEKQMDMWERLSDFVGSFSQRTGIAGSLANALDPDTWLPGGRDAAFTLALIALAAKMAVADGVVTASEERAFKATVEIAAGHEAQVARVFNLAKQDVAGYDAYARKVSRFFQDSPETLEHVLDSLFYIATADGLVHEAELDYLRSVSDIFGFDDVRFEQMASQHVQLEAGVDPYAILGLAPNADAAEIRRVYRALVAEHHPDRLIAKGVPEDLIDIATDRMKAINLAYQALTKPVQNPMLAAPDPASA